MEYDDKNHLDEYRRCPNCLEWGRVIKCLKTNKVYIECWNCYKEKGYVEMQLDIFLHQDLE
ncbi:MAG: hypothetical protein PVH88_01900 [Ignavibacteria bacterium]|jgi:hypothetical protein